MLHATFMLNILINNTIIHEFVFVFDLKPIQLHTVHSTD